VEPLSNLPSQEACSLAGGLGGSQDGGDAESGKESSDGCGAPRSGAPAATHPGGIRPLPAGASGRAGVAQDAGVLRRHGPAVPGLPGHDRGPDRPAAGGVRHPAGGGLRSGSQRAGRSARPDGGFDAAWSCGAARPLGRRREGTAQYAQARIGSWINNGKRGNIASSGTTVARRAARRRPSARVPSKTGATSPSCSPC